MKRILGIAHQPSENTQALALACDKGFARACELADTSFEASVLKPSEVCSRHILAADGVFLLTTENFGSMAGLVKDMFERTYYHVIEEKEGLPIAYCVRAGLDGTGTIRSVDSILTGLKWKLIQPPLLLKGRWQDDFLDKTEELAATLALGCAENLY